MPDLFKVHIPFLPHGISRHTARCALEAVGLGPISDVYCFHKNDKPSSCLVTLTTPTALDVANRVLEGNQA